MCSTLLAFAAAFLVLFEPATLSSGYNASWSGAEWPLTMRNFSIASDDCSVHFVGILPTLQYLVENALTGGEFFACGAGSDLSGWFWVLSMLFYAVSGLLMLNMLIAMMAKTFENIADSAAVNYQLVLAQSTCSLNDQPPATAPLNLLMTPYIVLVILFRLLFDRRCKLKEPELFALARKQLSRSRLMPSWLRPNDDVQWTSRVMPGPNSMGEVSARHKFMQRNSMGSLSQSVLRRSTTSFWDRAHEISVQKGEKASGNSA